LPSIQWTIHAAFSPNQVSVVGVNYSSSVAWLKNYRGQKGISYPFVFDPQTDLFRLYQVGSPYGNIPPTYIIIDTAGVVKYRTDNQYNRFQEMKTTIEGLLRK
jgi:peroxiredoxin